MSPLIHETSVSAEVTEESSQYTKASFIRLLSEPASVETIEDSRLVLSIAGCFIALMSAATKTFEIHFFGPQYFEKQSSTAQRPSRSLITHYFPWFSKVPQLWPFAISGVLRSPLSFYSILLQFQLFIGWARYWSLLVFNSQSSVLEYRWGSDPSNPTDFPPWPIQFFLYVLRRLLYIFQVNFPFLLSFLPNNPSRPSSIQWFCYSFFPSWYTLPALFRTSPTSYDKNLLVRQLLEIMSINGFFQL